MDYWNLLVLELFESHQNLENTAVTSGGLMQLQVFFHNCKSWAWSVCVCLYQYYILPFLQVLK